MTRPGPASVDERLLELCPVVLFRQRADLSFEYISPKIQEWTGVLPEEWLQNKGLLQQLIYAPDTGAYFKHFDDVKVTKLTAQFNFRMRHRDSGLLTALMETRRAVPEPDGSISGFEGGWIEIPLDTFEAPWRDAYNALAIGASHEFNNKLTAIVSLSDLFLGDVGPKSPMAPGLGTMRSTAYGISEVLHQLAAQYFAQPGRRELVDLNAIVNEMTGLLRRCISSRIEILCDVHSQPIPVTVDAVWLRRAWLILATLATKRIPENGTVKFATSGGSHAIVTFGIESLGDRRLVVRSEEERPALSEAARFASAHGGLFKSADAEFVLTMALEDLL